MRIFSAKSVVVLATLAGASGWAQVSIQQGNQPAVPVTQVYIAAPRPAGDRSGLQPVTLHATATPVARRTVYGVTEPAALMDPAPEQETANMGMMILVGLGMVGTVIVKNNRS